MCEFDVYLDGEKIFEEAVYFERKNNNLIAKNILGNEKKLGNVEIRKIDVSSEKLILTQK